MGMVAKVLESNGDSGDDGGGVGDDGYSSRGGLDDRLVKARLEGKGGKGRGKAWKTETNMEGVCSP